MKRKHRDLWLFSLVALLTISMTACNEGLVTPGESDTEIESLGKKPAWTPGGLHLGAGEVSIVYDYPEVGTQQIPEGIAFDPDGNMYLSNRIGSGGDWTENRVEKITPHGSHSILAQLGASGDCGASGVLGLTTDSYGNVYAAMGSCTSDNGVFKITPGGAAMHLAGSEAMVFPNALTFDSNGTLYVTDTFGGAVYRQEEGGPFELWLADPLLDPDFTNPLPYGANGIAFHPPNHIYVANTAGSWIAHIPVLENGDPGTPQQILPTGPTAYLFFYPDGIAVDVHGMIYAAIPPAGTPPPPGIPPAPVPFAPVVKLDPSTGTATPALTPFFPGDPAADDFDTATSLAFGKGPRHHKSVFVVSGDLFNTPIGSGPVVTQVGVGVTGK